MSIGSSPAVLVDGLHFPEGPRWRSTSGDAAGAAAGKLWFSDILAGKVMAVDLEGRLETLAEVPQMASGLGWLADGTLLVVSVQDGKLLALRDGELSQVADMYDLSRLPCNDMVVDARGRAFVGSVGSGVDEEKHPGPGNMPHFSHILLVDFPPGAALIPGRVRIVAERMTTPNGSVITPDGRTLIVAESFGFRLTAFDIEADGSLVNRRIWADLGVPPDGICLDEEGCVWVAVPYYRYGSTGGYIRVEEGGKVRQQFDVEGYSPYACTLGGAEMRTLFLCESAILGLPRYPGDGRIFMVDVEVPGSGSP